MSVTKTVLKHLVLFIPADQYLTAIGGEHKNLSKHDLLDLQSLPNIEIIEFGIATEQNMIELQEAFDNYKAHHPIGYVVFAMLFDTNELTIPPVRFYNPTIKIKFGV